MFVSGLTLLNDILLLCQFTLPHQDPESGTLVAQPSEKYPELALF